jgi:hypothetical protein
VRTGIRRQWGWLPGRKLTVGLRLTSPAPRAVDEPESLTWLRTTTAAMLSHIDLPDLLFEVQLLDRVHPPLSHATAAARCAGWIV